ncbi:MAG: hypothetical protein IKN06_00010 [Bacteroidales bacterium]|nr:hypothetical protein [Bacteroidales bacterium]
MGNIILVKLKPLIFLLLFLPTIVFAREPDKISLSLTPFFKGGMVGIKDFSSSSLAYNGPLAGGNLRISANSTKIDYFVDAVFSYGWLSNDYHKAPERMFNQQFDLSAGGMTGLFCNSTVFVKAGGALGFMQNVYYNESLVRAPYHFALDAKLCLSAELMLRRGFFLLIEDRLPFVSYIWTFAIKEYSFITPDHSWKAFPGNEVTIGIGRTLRDGNALMLFLRQDFFSTGHALYECFQVQRLELGLAFRFGLTKHAYDGL